MIETCRRTAANHTSFGYHATSTLSLLSTTLILLVAWLKSLKFISGLVTPRPGTSSSRPLLDFCLTLQQNPRYLPQLHSQRPACMEQDQQVPSCTAGRFPYYWHSCQLLMPRAWNEDILRTQETDYARGQQACRQWPSQTARSRRSRTCRGGKRRCVGMGRHLLVITFIAFRFCTTAASSL